MHGDAVAKVTIIRVDAPARDPAPQRVEPGLIARIGHGADAERTGE